MAFLKRVRRRFQPWQVVEYNGLRVQWKQKLQGGGHTFGQEYVKLLQERGMPKSRRVFEWCSGPAFIGFSLLAHDLCETLCLADVNPEAVKACRRTIRDNGLEDKVTVYHSDNLDDIPATEKWDLVVGNPPHYDKTHVGNLRAHDAGWRLHERFYDGIVEHLDADGVILLQENNFASSVETFRPMIERNGLRVIFTSPHEVPTSAADAIYFLGCTPSDAPDPTWLVG